MKIKVLMTGAGAPGGPGIIKALQQSSRIDLVVADTNNYASGKFLNKEFFQIPSAADKNFIAIVLAYCIKEKVDIIFPLVTRELFLFSANKQLFLENNIKIVVSNYEWLSIANDKSKLYNHLFNSNVLVPTFKVVNTIEEFKEAVSFLGYPNLPVCMKPSISNGSRGIRILDESKNDFDLLFNHKPNNTFTNLKNILEVLGTNEIPELLVSEYLPGMEYTIDTIVKDHKAKVVLPRQRTKMNGGISVQGTFEKNEEIINYCVSIIETMKLNGPIGIQVKQGADGIFKILEINPRIQGTSTSALGLSINLPLISILQEFEEVNYPNTEDIKWGTSFVRYYEELFY